MKNLVLFLDDQLWGEQDTLIDVALSQSLLPGMYIYQRSTAVWYVWQDGLVSVRTDSVPELYRAWVLIL